MSAPAVIDLGSIVRGDTTYLDVAVVQADGSTPQNLSGLTLRFVARRRAADGASDFLVNKAVGSGITVTNAAGGLCTVTLAAGDTEALPLYTVSLVCDLEAQSGSEVWTLWRGTLTVVPDIARSA